MIGLCSCYAALFIYVLVPRPRGCARACMRHRRHRTQMQMQMQCFGHMAYTCVHVLAGNAIWYGMVWYGMVWYGMVWYGMVWYGMVGVCAVLCADEYTSTCCRGLPGASQPPTSLSLRCVSYPPTIQPILPYRAAMVGASPNWTRPSFFAMKYRTISFVCRAIPYDTLCLVPPPPSPVPLSLPAVGVGVGVGVGAG